MQLCKYAIILSQVSTNQTSPTTMFSSGFRFFSLKRDSGLTCEPKLQSVHSFCDLGKKVAYSLWAPWESWNSLYEDTCAGLMPTKKIRDRVCNRTRVDGLYYGLSRDCQGQRVQTMKKEVRAFPISDADGPTRTDSYNFCINQGLTLFTAMNLLCETESDQLFSYSNTFWSGLRRRTSGPVFDDDTQTVQVGRDSELWDSGEPNLGPEDCARVYQFKLEDMGCLSPGIRSADVVICDYFTDI